MQALNPLSLLGSKQQRLAPKLIIAAAALCVSANLIWRTPRRRKTPYELSPPKSLPLEQTKGKDIEDLPYPPDALPGARDVETPYGSIRVYEWGPQDGERVLFVHGISTPVVALGDLGHGMAAKGYRVMMFDLFGRGYSDAPNDLAYDTRLFVTQLLLVLASSSIPWTAPTGFHLVGYSLGGGLSVAFTRYFPHLVRSLTLIAPCGLIRRHHVGWRSWLYYNSGLLPEVLVKRLVRRRIRPATVRKPADLVAAESSERVPVNGDGDANGGAGFDSAAISRTRPHVTVASVVAWQVDHHEGFRVLSRILQSRRHSGLRGHSGDAEVAAGLEGGKIFVVLGKDDGVIVMDEMIEDAHAVLGREGVEVVVLEGGHELPITSSGSVAESIEGFWKSR
ncbi:alpha/beta-hydrolase [Xylaria sp. FL0043]|nr:alpha/beta-hydrolase [Xylaria sp. FL0043]